MAHLPITTLDTLERLQRKAARICMRYPLFKPINHTILLHRLTLPTLFSRRKLKHVMLAHSLHYKYVPLHIASILPPTALPVNYTLRQRHCYSLPVTTWSASAKLAVIFPGFSFATGLVLCNYWRFFLSSVLLLGFGKLLSLKKKCHCRFVVMCVGFTTNCQHKSRSKSLPPGIHQLLFHTPRPTQ